MPRLIPGRSRLLIVCLIIVLPVIGCEGPGRSSTGPKDDRLTIADHIPFTTLNPFLAIDGSAANLLELLYDTLIRIDEHGEILPHLAESWTVSKDLKRWRFDLRKGVLFQDGTELKARDVLRTFQLIMDHGHPLYRGYTKQIESILIPDDYAVEFVLNAPLSTFLSFANMIGVFAGATESGDIDPLDPGFQPAGTGPYKLVKLDSLEASFERHDRYFRGRPDVKTVTVRFLPDQETIWARLMREEVDAFDLFGPESYHVLTQIPTYQTLSMLKPYYSMMLLDTSAPRFKDVRVRRALNLAVDKERIVEKSLKGHGRACASTVYPGHWSFDRELDPYPHDPRQALTLLTDAGWRIDPETKRLFMGATPFEISLLVNADETLMPEISRSIERDLEMIGITARTQALPPGEFFGSLERNEYDAAILTFCAGMDPDFNFTFWHSSTERAAGFIQYVNADVDRLLTAGRRTIDQRDRADIYHQFQRAIHDDPPGVFLYWMEYLIAVHQRFDNVNVKMVSGAYFRDIPNWTVQSVRKE